MITRGPLGSIGIVPDWYFSTNPAVNPHINPFVSPPSGTPGIAGLGSRFGATVIDQRSLGITMVDQARPSLNGCIGCGPGLGFVMRDRSVAKYGPTQEMSGAGSAALWTWQHKGELALVGGILGVAAVAAWLLA